MRSVLILLAALAAPIGALAEEAALQPANVSMDAATLQRGATLVMTNCHSCHSLKYLRYQDLVKIGVSKADIGQWRGDQPMSAPLVATMSEADATQAFGIKPPDLSLMAQARDGGANYVYSYLLAYKTSGDTTTNSVYSATKMPDALGISAATDEASKQEIAGKARDATSFLVWAADPHAQQRKRMGMFVIIYLLVLTTLLYLLKRRIWSRLPPPQDTH